MKLTVDQALRKAATLARQGQNAEAAKLYGTILQAFPANARAKEGLRALHVAKPALAREDVDRLVALYRAGRMEEAAGLAAELALRHPDTALLRTVEGGALAHLRRFDAALAAYDRALVAAPDDVEALNGRGNVLKALGRTGEALANYDAALRLWPDIADLHGRRGNALLELGRYDEALASFDAALRINPALDAIAAPMLYVKAQLCDWTPPPPGIDPARTGLDAAVVPFTLLMLDDDPARHLARARQAAKAFAGIVPLPSRAPVARPERLRIGYFAADFYEHACMYLIGKLLEVHDRDRFEIHAFAFGHHPPDPMQRRARAAVDAFHDVDGLSDRQAAELARAQGIDIAVDLSGQTRNARVGILAHRAAPIQMNYLGYACTLGADFADYIVADGVVIAPGDERFYTEKVIRLPHAYLATDNTLPIASAQPARAQLGLPEQGFVFACFNSNNKISPAEFDIWMRLLGKVAGSVLWLLEGNDHVRGNLRREAAARGIDPERLVFAGKVPHARHLARHRCADLFLDTFIYNAHTTGVDALWAGLPIVTLPGKGFASRVAGSLLRAVGLPELVTDSAEAYEQLAFGLATDPQRLAAVKAKLAANRLTAPLFDSEAFARGLERGYDLAYDRWSAGLPAEHIDLRDQ